VSFFNDLMGLNMGNNGSALETLAAFAICFVAGVASTMGVGVYAKLAKRKKNI
jgi:hypothetical protein